MVRTPALIAAAALAFAPALAHADEVVVFAAASLADALAPIETAFEAESGHELTISLAGSSSLARQIQQGAPADVFISANVGWMDTLQGEDLIVPESRVDLVANSLVLVGAEGAAPVELSTLPDALGDNYLAMALVESVPAGIYGKASLESLGLWDAVEGRIAQADNVRAALALVATGASPFGIVYATDAVAEARVSVLATFPADSHPPIVYPAAIIAGHDGAGSEAFMAFLQTDTARSALEAQGFTVLGE